MIGREKRVLLRHYLEQGMNKAVIARDLGVSRRTVYHWIETGQLDRELDEERVGYGPRCLMPSKLDPYKPLIYTRLKEYPKLTAVKNRVVCKSERKLLDASVRLPWRPPWVREA